jgi:hypothetical protein
MVYDDNRQRIVLFGGYYYAPPGQHFDDTWEFDPSIPAWTELSTVGRPGARHSHAMAYDYFKECTVLYGGGGSEPGLPSETWTLDAADNWTQVFAPNDPGPRVGAKTVYHPLFGRVMLYGGTNEAALLGIWAFDGNDWME